MIDRTRSIPHDSSGPMIPDKAHLIPLLIFSCTPPCTHLTPLLSGGNPPLNYSRWGFLIDERNLWSSQVFPSIPSDFQLKTLNAVMNELPCRYLFNPFSLTACHPTKSNVLFETQKGTGCIALLYTDRGDSILLHLNWYLKFIHTYFPY